MLKRLLSEEVTPVAEQLKKFITKKVFLRSLLKVNNEELDQIISKLFMLIKGFTCSLIATFYFHMWNIFEHVLRVFIF